MTDYVLEILDGDRAGEIVPLDRDRITIGRKPTNDVVLMDEKVSGQHAEVVREEERWVLRDLGSTNGTLLDGHRVEEVALSPFDTFQIGRLRVTFKEPGATSPMEAMTVHRVDQELLARSKRRRSGAGVMLLMVVAAAGLAAWAWLQGRGEGGGATTGHGVREIPHLPGDKLAEGTGSVEDPDGWSMNAGGAGFEIGGPAHSGATSLVSAAAVDGERVPFALARTSQPITVLTGQPLRLIGFVTTGGGGRGSLRLRFSSSVEAQAPVLLAASVPTAADDDWQQVELKATVPPGMDRVEIEVLALLPADDAEVRADDLALLPADAAPPALELHAGPAHLVGTPTEVAIRSADGPVLSAVVPLAPDAPPLAALAAADELTFADVGVDLAVTQKPDEGFALSASGVAGLELQLPAAATAGGVRARAGDEPFVLQSGAFELPQATELLVGAGAARMLVRLPAAAPVHALERGDHVMLDLPGTDRVELVTVFEKQRADAQAALERAKVDAKAGQPGRALDDLSEIAERLPHDDAVLAEATRMSTGLLRTLRQELDELRQELAEADFFHARRAYQRIGARLDELVASYGQQNIPDADAVSAMRKKAADALAELDAARNQERRAALQQLAEVLDASGENDLHDLVQDYIERH